MDTEPSLCADNDDLSSQSEESPPLSEAGFSGQSEGKCVHEIYFCEG